MGVTIDGTSLPVHLRYHEGSLTLTTQKDRFLSILEKLGVYSSFQNFMVWDTRTHQFRGYAYHYQDILSLLKDIVLLQDETLEPSSLTLQPASNVLLRPYQEKLLDAWEQKNSRGVLELPTGAGKTVLGLFAILKKKKPTLVIVPTIILLHQWRERIQTFFGSQSVGQLGDGVFKVEPITVSTYASALIHIPHLGGRFHFLIFDECHHLGSEQSLNIGLLSAAPFRLGLSATVARPDGKHKEIFKAVGPLIQSLDASELPSQTLAESTLKTILVDLTPEERKEYEECQRLYTHERKNFGSSVSTPEGWKQFVSFCATTERGRKALKSHSRMTELAHEAKSKFHVLWALVHRHNNERILIFTKLNDFAYRIGRFLAVPVITQHTSKDERNMILALFKESKARIIVTSNVLNEGWDIPDAKVAIIASGKSSYREYTQRKGRVLRKDQDNVAFIYQIVTKDTVEILQSQRRHKKLSYDDPV